jgi:hypothetical protein
LFTKIAGLLPRDHGTAQAEHLRRLIETGVLGVRGTLGTDASGPTRAGVPGTAFVP